MSEPKRIQRKRTKGWRMPENTIYVGRGTKWGNPFKEQSRPVNAAKFRSWLKGEVYPQMNSWQRITILKSLADLRGKNLACWCPLDCDCHADTLLELANGPQCIFCGRLGPEVTSNKAVCMECVFNKRDAYERAGGMTYDSYGNPAPQDGDIIRCRKPKQELIGDAIYYVDFVDGETGLLALKDREDGKGQRLGALYGAWRFQLLRRSGREERGGS